LKSPKYAKAFRKGLLTRFFENATNPGEKVDSPPSEPKWGSQKSSSAFILLFNCYDSIKNVYFFNHLIFAGF